METCSIVDRKAWKVRCTESADADFMLARKQHNWLYRS